MQFNTGYKSFGDLYSPMDRGFYQAANEEAEGAGLGIGVADLGMSVPMGIAAQNAQGIYSKIRSGAGKLEIGFPGAVSGNRNAHTPEMYGKDQRQAIRELGMINEVEFTTHAAYQMMGMTGAIEQGSDLVRFDMNHARVAQEEVERAIDFAADVARGGSVVVHTGEFTRPLTDMYLDGVNLSRMTDDGRLMFKRRLTEEKDAKFFLIDDRTGQAMSTVEKDRLVAFPVWNRYEEGNKDFWERGNGKGYEDEDHNWVQPGDYIDYRGNRIANPFDPYKGRVPRYNKEIGRFVVEYKDYNYFGQEAEEKNEYYKAKAKQEGRSYTDYDKITTTEAFLQATLETNEGHSRGWALQYGERVDKQLKELNALKAARKFYQSLDEQIPEEDKWKLMKREAVAAHLGHAIQELVPPDNKSPLAILDDAIRDTEKAIEFARQASTSQEQQAADTAETKRHIKEPIKYIERFAIRGYAEAALHAMERSVDPNNPIVITMENIFPDRFGGHPQELKWLIDKAREKFVDYLTNKEIELGVGVDGRPALVQDPETKELEIQKQPNPWFRGGLSKEQAEKLAEQHIKATIDTGHMNMWRKYFQPKVGASPEQNESEFKKWYTEQIDDLAKNGYIGNIHLTDNFGYQDDHLAPGQGNTPVKEVVAILQKYGYDKAITVEPGADASTDISDFHGLMKTWRYFGSSIYGMSAGGGGRQTWNQMQDSYFGRTEPPYFIFGSYSPSNDWTLWTQTPME